MLCSSPLPEPHPQLPEVLLLPLDLHILGAQLLFQTLHLGVLPRHLPLDLLRGLPDHLPRDLRPPEGVQLGAQRRCRRRAREGIVAGLGVTEPLPQRPGLRLQTVDVLLQGRALALRLSPRALQPLLELPLPRSVGRVPAARRRLERAAKLGARALEEVPLEVFDAPLDVLLQIRRAAGAVAVASFEEGCPASFHTPRRAQSVGPRARQPISYLAASTSQLCPSAGEPYGLGSLPDPCREA